MQEHGMFAKHKRLVTSVSCPLLVLTLLGSAPAFPALAQKRMKPLAFSAAINCRFQTPYPPKFTTFRSFILSPRQIQGILRQIESILLMPIDIGEIAYNFGRRNGQ